MVTLEIKYDGMDREIQASFARMDRVIEGIVNIPRDEVRRKVIEFIGNNEEASYADLQENLNLDLELIVEICSELAEGNVIEEIDETTDGI